MIEATRKAIDKTIFNNLRTFGELNIILRLLVNLSSFLKGLNDQTEKIEITEKIKEISRKNLQFSTVAKFQNNAKEIITKTHEMLSKKAFQLIFLFIVLKKNNRYKIPAGLSNNLRNRIFNLIRIKSVFISVIQHKFTIFPDNSGKL